MSSSEEETFVVEKILDDKVERGKRVYLIKWKGYGKAHNSWEQESNILDKSVIKEYKANGKKRTRSRTPAKVTRSQTMESPQKKKKTLSRSRTTPARSSSRTTPAKRTTNTTPSTRARKKAKEASDEDESDADDGDSSDNDSIANHTRSAVKRRKAPEPEPKEPARAAPAKSRSSSSSSKQPKLTPRRTSSRSSRAEKAEATPKPAASSGKIEVVRRKRRVEIPAKSNEEEPAAASTKAPKKSASAKSVSTEAAGELSLLRSDFAQPIGLYMLVTLISFAITAINCSPHVKQWVGSFSPLVSAKESDPLAVVFLGNAILFFVGFLSVRQWAEDTNKAKNLQSAHRFSASSCHLVQSVFVIMAGFVFEYLEGVSASEQVKIIVLANMPFAVQALASERDTFDMTHTISLVNDIVFGAIFVMWAPDNVGVIEFVRLAVLFRALFDLLVNVREHTPSHPAHVILVGVALVVAFAVSGAKFLQFRDNLQETAFIMIYITVTSFLTITRYNLETPETA